VPRHREGRDDRADDLPARGDARARQGVGQLGQDEADRGRCGDGVAEGDGRVVTGGEHAAGRRDQLVEHAVRRRRARAPGVESGLEAVEAVQDGEPAADPGAVRGLVGVEPGQRGRRGDGVERAAQLRVAGHGLVARRPEGQALGQFVDQ
jgi:hypothetical protein